MMLLPLALIAWLGVPGPLQGQAQTPPQTPVQSAPPAAAAKELEVACDDEGGIKCLQQVETVTGNRSADDMRVVAKFIQLVSERNRRYYLSWQTKAPSAAYEVVKRVKDFPYLPNGDSYGVQNLEVVLAQATNSVTVRYLKKPGDPKSNERISYSGKLDAFIKTLEQENEKLKKYDVKKF